MKTAILSLFIFASFSLAAQEPPKQSLKDLLFSGKLKNDSGTVIRNTDDLSTKIDTSTRKPATVAEAPKPVTEQPKAATAANPAATNPATTNTIAQTNTAGLDTSSVIADPDISDMIAPDTTVAEATETVAAEPVKAVAPRTNTKIWRDHTDALTAGLKDVLSNKKIKKETYFILVDYEVDGNGIVNVTGVTSTPENALLQSNILQRLQDGPPTLNATDAADKSKKLKRRYSFSVTKE